MPPLAFHIVNCFFVRILEFVNCFFVVFEAVSICFFGIGVIDKADRFQKSCQFRQHLRRIISAFHAQ